MTALEGANVTKATLKATGARRELTPSPCSHEPVCHIDEPPLRVSCWQGGRQGVEDCAHPVALCGRAQELVKAWMAL